MFFGARQSIKILLSNLKLTAVCLRAAAPWGKRGWKTFNGVLRGMVLYLQKVSGWIITLHYSNIRLFLNLSAVLRFSAMSLVFVCVSGGLQD